MAPEPRYSLTVALTLANSGRDHAAELNQGRTDVKEHGRRPEEPDGDRLLVSWMDYLRRFRCSVSLVVVPLVALVMLASFLIRPLHDDRVSMAVLTAVSVDCWCWCRYLSNVEEGGETIFPRYGGRTGRVDFSDCTKGLKVKPVEG